MLAFEIYFYYFMKINSVLRDNKMNAKKLYELILLDARIENTSNNVALYNANSY
jgi:hypothetical protein